MNTAICAVPDKGSDAAHVEWVSMIVATADHHSYPGLAASEEAHLDDVWNAGHAHWVSLAPSAQLITVEHTSHNIQLDRPDVVVDKIHELL